MAEPTSDGEKPAEEKKSSKPMSPKVKVGFAIVVLLLLVAAILWGIRWWTSGRYMESTNNAYLAADATVVAPRVGGNVTEVLVKADQQVIPSQALIRIDSRPYAAALAEAEAVVMARRADLGRTRAEIARQRAVVQEATAKTELERAGLAAASAEAVRSTELAARGADSGQRRDEAVAARRQQEARLNASAAAARGATMQTDLLVAQLRQNEAALEAAKAARDRALVDLEATTVTASQAGRVGDRTVVAGQFVQPGTRVMTIVPTTEIYLVANFKETQISRMRVGQPVTVEVDALPDRKLAGKVLSLAPGTGAQFALLPPENATGNFNKIVQRVPVRIALTVPAEVGSLVVPGLSAEVEVDTR